MRKLRRGDEVSDQLFEESPGAQRLYRVCKTCRVRLTFQNPMVESRPDLLG